MGCERLYLFCDGHKRDPEKTDAVRKILREAADERTRSGKKTTLLFSDVNLGPQKGPTVAMSEFFNEVEFGHIIEDDIVLHPLFFQVHGRALTEFRDKGFLWIGQGYPLPESPFTLISTQINGLVAWSSWREQIQQALAATATKRPWEERGFRLLEGLHLKTKIFLWKEFERLKRNPTLWWDYHWTQFQLDVKMPGLTPTARLHKNIGVDGSGHNCQNVFGARESWDESALKAFLMKQTFVGEDAVAEKKMELMRYGRILQSLGRKGMRLTPQRWKHLWRPITSNDI